MMHPYISVGMTQIEAEKNLMSRGAVETRLSIIAASPDCRLKFFAIDEKIVGLRIGLKTEVVTDIGLCHRYERKETDVWESIKEHPPREHAGRACPTENSAHGCPP